MRFEDVISDQRATIGDSLEFLLSIDSVKGRYIEKRINDAIKPSESSGIYKPRSGKFNASAKFFNAEHQELMK